MSASTYYGQPFPLSTPIAVAVDETSPFQRLGFNVLLVFVFLAFSRILDLNECIHILRSALPLVHAYRRSGGRDLAVPAAGVQRFAGFRFPGIQPHFRSE